MGNRNSNNSNLLTKNWERIDPKTLRNIITEQIINENELQGTNEQQKQQILVNCQLRINKNHKNIIKLIYYKNKYQNMKTCTLNYQFNILIYTEYVHQLFFNFIYSNNNNHNHIFIQQQDKQECYCQNLINGCYYLCQHYNFFEISSSQIWIVKNTNYKEFKAKLKVWISKNPASYKPDKPSTQQQMIFSIINIYNKFSEHKICNKLNIQNFNKRLKDQPIKKINELLNMILNIHNIKKKQEIILIQNKQQNKLYKPKLFEYQLNKKNIPITIFPEKNNSSSFLVHKYNSQRKNQIIQSIPFNQKFNHSIYRNKVPNVHLFSNGGNLVSNKTNLQSTQNINSNDKIQFFYTNKIYQKQEKYSTNLKSKKFKIEKQLINEKIDFRLTNNNNEKQISKLHKNQNQSVQKEQGQQNQNLLGNFTFYKQSKIVKQTTLFEQNKEQHLKLNQNDSNSDKKIKIFKEQQQNVVLQSLKLQKKNISLNKNKTQQTEVGIDFEKIVNQPQKQICNSNKYKNKIGQIIEEKYKLQDQYINYIKKYKQVKEMCEIKQNKHQNKQRQNKKIKVNLEKEKKDDKDQKKKKSINYIELMKNYRDQSISKNSRICETNSETNELYQQKIKRKQQEILKDQILIRSQSKKKINDVEKFEKYKMQKKLQKEKQMIKKQMQDIMKNYTKEQLQIKQKVKHKKATFAQLKAEAFKILNNAQK